MPSCSVKLCKNRSDGQKKDQGITFHRFPKGTGEMTELWRKDWIQIIRKCNNDSDWTPHYSSVVCSEHFEHNDFYTTKCGRRRVGTYAVPTKFLYESEPPPDKQPAAVSFISNASQQSVYVTVPALEQPGSSATIVKQEYVPDDPNNTNKVPESAYVTVPALKQLGSSVTIVKKEYVPDEPNNTNDPESAYVTVPALGQPGSAVTVVKQEYVPDEPNNTNEPESAYVTVPALEQPGSSVTIVKQEYVPVEVEPNITNESPKSSTVTAPPQRLCYSPNMFLPRKQQINIPSSMNESSTVTAPPPRLCYSPNMVLPQEQINVSSSMDENSSESETEDQALSTYIGTPSISYLKQCIDKERAISQRQRRVIKTLKQKIRRLQTRNKSLKDTVKSLKRQ